MNIIKHGFHKAGGLALGVTLVYPIWGGDSKGEQLQKIIRLRIQLLVISIEFNIRYGKKKQITY